ncbi:helix-turn-helix transcriptional regulator [Kribbella sp. NBC_01505]|uniref:response regulator transcription factor n=1 Tax=Kribbella sp. NBC_01505 TaxID=2903580 RepID=UPI003867D949
MSHATRVRAYDRVALLGEARLPLADLFSETARLLDRALPRDGSCWHAMDPVSLVETSRYDENLGGPDQLVAEVAYLPDDYNTFVELAQGRRHSGILSEQTGGDVHRSRRYRELLQPWNVEGELRAAFVVDGVSWGCFSLLRIGSGDFTPAERDFAHHLSPLLGRAFRAAGVHARPTAPGAELWPGVLVLDGNRKVESYTPATRDWLREFGFEGLPDRDQLPYELLTLAERVRITGQEASARVLGESDRWIEIHAAPATRSELWEQRVAIVVQAASVPSIAPLISAAYGLTKRERELTELLLRGCGTAEIAAQLFVSPHTVQSHLKSIFTKVGVRSRRELVGRINARV